MRSLFDLLPDIAGIFLAALRVSLFFVTKELQWLENRPKLRWAVAITLALIGLGGVASNAIQKAEDKTAREGLNGDIARLKDDIATMKRKLAETPNA